MVPVRGFCNAHVLVSLDTWRFGRHPATWRLVVDPSDDPLQLDFVGVAGLDVLLAIDSKISSLARRDATARAILAYLPKSLIELDAQKPHSVRYIKTRAVGIELKEFSA
jgi:hypothetical protein